MHCLYVFHSRLGNVFILLFVSRLSASSFNRPHRCHPISVRISGEKKRILNTFFLYRSQHFCVAIMYTQLLHYNRLDLCIDSLNVCLKITLEIIQQNYRMCWKWIFFIDNPYMAKKKINEKNEHNRKVKETHKAKHTMEDSQFNWRINLFKYRIETN